MATSKSGTLWDPRDQGAGRGLVRSLRAPLGEWEGVSTNDDGRVTALEFYSNGLSGEIPAELGSLSNLESLKLSNNGNGLSGEIPPELSSLSNLITLDLQSNALSGELPPELGSLSNLRDLELEWNSDLSGCVPSSLEDHLASWSDLGGLPYC